MIVKTEENKFYYITRNEKRERIGDGTLETAKELMEILPKLEAAGEF